MKRNVLTYVLAVQLIVGAVVIVAVSQYREKPAEVPAEIERIVEHEKPVAHKKQGHAFVNGKCIW